MVIDHLYCLLQFSALLYFVLVHVWLFAAGILMTQRGSAMREVRFRRRHRWRLQVRRSEAFQFIGRIEFFKWSRFVEKI